ILNEPLKLEPLQQAGAPQAVCELVAQCTVKKPQDRPPGFGPVIQQLERLMEELDAPTAVMPARQPLPDSAPERGRPGWMLPAILAAIAIVGVGLYFAVQPKALAPTLATPTGEMVLVPAGDFL